MELTLNPELEARLKEEAQRFGTTPEVIALSALRERFPPRHELPIPRDDWERDILSIGIDCGVSLSNEAISSDGIYE